MHLVFEDQDLSTQELTVNVPDADELHRRMRRLLPDLRVKRFVGVGTLQMRMDDGEPIRALAIYWQEEGHAFVQAEAIAYYEDGSTFRLDSERIKLVPLPESWLPPEGQDKA
jgi:hypothetical protein